MWQHWLGFVSRQKLWIYAWNSTDSWRITRYDDEQSPRNKASKTQKLAFWCFLLTSAKATEFQDGDRSTRLYTAISLHLRRFSKIATIFYQNTHTHIFKISSLLLMSAEKWENTEKLTFVSLKLCFLGFVNRHNELFFSYLWSCVHEFTSSSTNPIASWWGKNAHTLFNYNYYYWFKAEFLFMLRCICAFNVTSL